ncbi:hypothetical protein [Caulobacter sp. 17J65-9]|uniref:hypothetical protein n=1 Tax=Caulobacter sp. 17J65-9 TaxID=2709382 RepID=UPI0013C7139A|nr:hypothetical protein [Caulobacter sp. 17J65-9]NEX93289.1 hypothetical protein [Caulobacter sp. 17J65-9]
MTIVCSDFESPDVSGFSAAERRLLKRYHHQLISQDSLGRVPPARLYYAAASAVECLRHARTDARACRTAGGSPEEIRRTLETGRGDALFYLELARAWIVTADGGGALRLVC